MMGVKQEQDELFNYEVNLGKRVRPNHPLRAIRAHIDFNFVREEVAQFYGQNGNVSVDPAIILKMMFLLFYDNVPSERELVDVIGERLDYRWFLGYGLDDEIPNHSVLSKARKRWGAEVFESLFVRVVVQCVEAGLVGGDKIHMDGSLVDADAARKESHSNRAKRDRVRRKWLMEGSFADSANNHGFKRSRWRRLHNQKIQDYLIAAIQNVRILMRHLQRKRKVAVMALWGERDYRDKEPYRAQSMIRGHLERFMVKTQRSKAIC